MNDSGTNRPESILRLNDDVLYLICQQIEADYLRAKSMSSWDSAPPRHLLEFAATCKRLRAIAAPITYSRLTHTDDYKTTSQFPLSSRFLYTLENSGLYQQYAREVTFRKLWVRFDVLQRLAGAFTTLSKLQSLTFDIWKAPAETVRAFRFGQDDASPTMCPQVRSLTVNYDLQGLIRCFPNIRKLSIMGPYNDQRGPPTLETLLHWTTESALPNLRSFDLAPLSPHCVGSDSMWDLLKLLAERVPQLEHFGTLFKHGLRVLYDTDTALLSRFPRLASLVVELDRPPMTLFMRVETCEDCDLRHKYRPSRLCADHRSEMLLFIGRRAFNVCPKLWKVELYGEQGELICTERNGEGHVLEMEWRYENRWQQPFHAITQKIHVPEPGSV